MKSQRMEGGGVGRLREGCVLLVKYFNVSRSEPRSESDELKELVWNPFSLYL